MRSRNAIEKEYGCQKSRVKKLRLILNPDFWLLSSFPYVSTIDLFLKLPLLVIAFQDMKDTMMLFPMKTTLQAKEGKNV